MTLALYSNGKIAVQASGAPGRYVNNNVRLKKIFPYSQYLTGLTTDGTIVWLEQERIPGESWEWKRYANLPTRITSCSVTLNQEHLWLHDAAIHRGYLYKGATLINQVDHYPYRRVYGHTIDVYAEIDEHRQTAKIHPSGETFTDVYDLVISHPDSVTVLKNSERDRYRGLAIVNWTAMYINM